MAILQLPQTFRPSRLKMFALLSVSLIFVAGGVWLVPTKPVLGYANILFFGLCVLVFLIQLHPKSSYLTLTRDGFTFSAMFRSHFVKWHDVTAFKVTRIGINRFVGWTYTPSFSGHSSLRRTNLALSGIEAALPDTYGIAPDALAQLLNEQRNIACADA